MKNNLKLLSGFGVLSALLVLFVFSASALGCVTCNPPCGPCQTCQGQTCVNNCLTSLCQTCVNGHCESICSSSLCEICVNGVCQSACNPDTTKCVNGSCVPWTMVITYTYDEVGNRISMTDPAGTTSYTYDYLHRLTAVTNPDSKTISYQYDPNGNRTQLTDPASNTTTYTYNGTNQLTGVNAPAGSTTYQYTLGRLTRVNYPNGTYTQYTYNAKRNWLTSLANKDSAGTALSSYSYTYDNKGNRLSVTENDGSVVAYGYDDIYQLTAETRTGANPYTITYQYGSAGNRTEMVKGAVTTTYTDNNDNQLLTETTSGITTAYSYDLNGNLVSKTTGGAATTYGWDWNNHLLSVTEPNGSTVYDYDGDGTRISKTKNGVKTKYINDVARGLVQVLMETDNAGVVQAIYNYGRDLISMNRADANSYYNYDGLGSARQLTDSSGAIVASYTYDSFGNRIASSGSVNNTYGYTGEQQFSEADALVYLRARYYDARVGRFISRDPVLTPMQIEDNFTWALPSLISQPEALLHPYIYCGNNPVNLVDPEGENPVSWMYHCIQCFRYIGKALDVANKCRAENPCDAQARWKCSVKDPSFKKAMKHCSECGIGSWGEPGPTKL